MMVYWNKIFTLKEDKKLGYVYFLDRTHPLANAQGKVYYHRHVVSLEIGRWVLPIEDVHHIDGDRKNNSPKNLIALLKSEHTLKHHPFLERINCTFCGVEFKPAKKKTKFCSPKCSKESKRKFNILKEELEKLVWSISTTKIAKRFRVTDNAIAKRCKLFGIKKPGRGYWAKQASLA